MPNVTGASQSDAESELKAAGLGVDVSEIPSDNVDKGKVIAQLPAAGTIVAPDTTVAIVVSSGPPAEDATVEVPDVRGQELKDAEEALTKLGLQANPTPVAGTAENKGDVLGAGAGRRARWCRQERRSRCSTRSRLTGSDSRPRWR